MLNLRLLLLLSFTALCVLMFAIISRTITITSKRDNFLPIDENLSASLKADDRKIANFVKALQFRTVSYQKDVQEYEDLLKFQRFIVKTYPTIHSSPLVQQQIINNYSLIYKVQGKNPDLKPYMLYGHLDVVPADVTEWDHPPFQGKIVDGFIYARGTIDNKQTVIGILEALEHRLKAGDLPVRSFYIGFGHDEEVGGRNGAYHMARYLEKEGVDSFEFLLDEGMMVTDGIMPGINKPMAIVGVAEKSMLTLNLSISLPGGHSSIPLSESSIGVLASAVNRLELNPCPSQLGRGIEKDQIEGAAPHTDVIRGVIFSNLWIFKPLLSWVLSKLPTGNALIRTTTAVTMFHGGHKANVLATKAYAIVNHRIHPAETEDEVIDHVKKIINDQRINVQKVINLSRGPFPVSPSDENSFGFQSIKTSILQTFHKSKLFVVPGLFVGNSDSGHFMNFTKNIYRFTPTYLYRGDERRFHGKNERMSIDNFDKCLKFYHGVMKLADRERLPPPHKHGEL